MSVRSTVNSLVQGIRRSTFAGRTDAYLTSAIMGEAVFEPYDGFLELDWRNAAIQRLFRYRENWAFYRGEQFQQMTKDGKKKMVLNYCRTLVDKSVDWMAATPPIIKAPSGNEYAADVVNLVLDMNDYARMVYDLFQVGSVSGDAYIQTTLVTSLLDPTTGQRQELPKNEWFISVRSLNSAYVYPVYNPDYTRMEACLIQYPISTANPVVIALDPDAVQRNKALYSLYITPTEIREWINRAEIPGSPYPNRMGEIGVAHIPNLPLATSAFGFADIDPIKELNMDLNTAATAVREIMDYHAKPVTLIFGARASQLEKAAYRLWCLPADARVENLQLQGELTIANQYMEMIKLSLGEFSNTPMAALSEIPGLANTSEAALKTLFLPSIEKAKRKELTYGGGLVETAGTIIRIAEGFLDIPITQNIEDPAKATRFTVEFPSPLPQDQGEKLDILQRLMDMGLESKLGALEKLGVENIPQKAIELLADARELLLTDVERAKASSGAIPNMRALSLGSLSLLTGLMDMWKELDKIVLDSADTVSQIEEKVASVAEQEAQMTEETETPQEETEEEEEAEPEEEEE